MSITIPATLDEVRDRFAALDGLARAQGWERAAIVWAHVEPDAGHGGKPPAGGRLSLGEFARRGFAGLTKRDTVASYHKAWQTAIDRGEVEPVNPGDTINLPATEWPPGEGQLERLPDNETRQQVRDAATDAGVSADSVARVVLASPNVIRAAVKASSRVQTAARQAVNEVEIADMERDAIASGGRVPSAEEIKNRARPPQPEVDAIAKMLRDWADVERAAAAYLAALAAYGPVLGEHREQVNAWAVKSIDIASASVEEEVDR